MESFAGRGQNSANLTLDWLLENNPDYAAAAVGPTDVFPSTQPILYRRDLFEVQSQGWFFFSQMPDVIYSRTFNGSFPAFASWAQFKMRESDKVFRVINIHTDFRSRSNRLQSMELVAQRIRPWIDADEDIFVVGDFNARKGAKTLSLVADTGITFAPVAGSTYHLNAGLNLFGSIDHIGYTSNMQVDAGPFVVREKFENEWPTDHYPVIVDFR